MGGHAIMVRVGHPHVMMATTMEGPFMIVMVAGIDVKKLPMDAPSCNYWNLHAGMMIMVIMFKLPTCKKKKNVLVAFVITWSGRFFFFFFFI